jgi:ArsR family transcriptional regulator
MAKATQPLINILKASADDLRMGILRVLQQDSFGVLELCRVFDIKQSGMSHHLKVLAKAELVATRREGNGIFYRRPLLTTNHPQLSLLQALFVQIDHTQLSTDIAERLALVQKERAEVSQAFFTQQSDRFEESQELIASYPQYADAATDLLAKLQLPDQQLAIEIGPGEGEFLLPLSQYFNKVIALDNSAIMLDKARHTAAHIDNIEFIEAELSHITERGPIADCLVMNMVLHHIPSPAEIIKQSSCLLKTGGALLITDLCHHDQQWARESCGDLWLGFESDDLTRWAQSANLVEDASQFLALRNGFQIQLRRFIKTNHAVLAPIANTRSNF